MTVELMTPGLNTKTLFRMNITVLCYLHQEQCLPPTDVTVPLPFLMNTIAFVSSSGRHPGFCLNQCFPNTILTNLNRRALLLLLEGLVSLG